jgi:hypothetical protein
MPIQQPSSTCPFGRGLTWYIYERHEKKVANAIRYTAIDPKNLKSWGEEYADMLRSIGDDVDSCFREMAKCVYRGCGCSGLLSSSVRSRLAVRRKKTLSRWDITDYKDIFEPIYQLSQNSVSVPFGLRGIPPLSPFLTFASGGTPTWWRAYNHIKHDYYVSMDKGKLQNVLSALAGLLILNLLHKCSQYYLAMTGTVSGGIKVGELTQTVGYQYLTEELQKSPLGIPASTITVPFTWLKTDIFVFEYRRI